LLRALGIFGNFFDQIWNFIDSLFLLLSLNSVLKIVQSAVYAAAFSLSILNTAIF